MTTRTKLALCAGLLAVAGGVGLMFRSPGKPEVEINFVRYEEDGAAVLALTNRGKSAVLGRAFHGSNFANVVLAVENESGPFQRMKIIARPPLPAPPATISVQCWPMPSLGRTLAEAVAIKTGFNLRSDSFVVTVDLPPRETNAPAQPVTP